MTRLGWRADPRARHFVRQFARCSHSDSECGRHGTGGDEWGLRRKVRRLQVLNYALLLDQSHTGSVLQLCFGRWRCSGTRFRTRRRRMPSCLPLCVTSALRSPRRYGLASSAPHHFIIYAVTHVCVCARADTGATGGVDHCVLGQGPQDPPLIPTNRDFTRGYHSRSRPARRFYTTVVAADVRCQGPLCC